MLVLSRFAFELRMRGIHGHMITTMLTSSSMHQWCACSEHASTFAIYSSYHEMDRETTEEDEEGIFARTQAQ
jgi:hypothetical protein